MPRSDDTDEHPKCYSHPQATSDIDSITAQPFHHTVDYYVQDMCARLADVTPGPTPLIHNTYDYHVSEAIYGSLNNVVPDDSQLASLPTTDKQRLGRWDGQCKSFLLKQTSYDVQRVLWKLELRMESAQRGRYLQTTYASTKPTVYRTFDEKFEDVTKALKTYKAFSKNLFDDEVTMCEKLALNPARELYQKERNGRTNKRKAKQVTYSVKNMADEELPEELRRKKRTKATTTPAET